MQELHEGVELSEQQTEIVCRGLLDLAAVDGVHESELELIAEFCGAGGHTADFDALQKHPFDLAEAAKVLKSGGDEVVESFLASAYLLIYADGEHSEAERKRVKEYADALGVSHERLEALHTRARLYLLQTLASNLRNKAAVREVAAQMGLNESDLAGLED
jgi:tellurite resistance protein